MKYNYNYLNEEGESAPYILEVGDTQIINPNHEQYIEAGYHAIVPEITSVEPNSIAVEIETLKQQLQETDYIAIKSIEGYDCDKLYPDWKEQRKAIRDKINELEK